MADEDMGIPTWAKSVLALVLQHGAAVAIALFLVWWMSQRIIVNQDSILSEIRAHRVDTALAGKIMTDFARDQDAAQKVLVLLQLQTCVNTASTDTQRRDCVRARENGR